MGGVREQSIKNYCNLKQSHRRACIPIESVRGSDVVCSVVGVRLACVSARSRTAETVLDEASFRVIFAFLDNTCMTCHNGEGSVLCYPSQYTLRPRTRRFTEADSYLVAGGVRKRDLY